jgi:hypothetical protein
MSGVCGHRDWHPTIARLPGCALVLMATAFTLAYLCDRTYVFQAPVLVALLLPVLWLVVQPATQICDGLFGRWLMLAILLLVWMAGVQALRADALPAGWQRFAERGAALATCMMVALGRVPVREMITMMGSAASLVTIIALVMDGLSGHLKPLDINSFGFGQINILTDTAGPSLLAWTVLMVEEARHRRRILPRDCVLLLLGLAAMAIIAAATHRRGVMAATAIAAMWPVTRWLYQRMPRTTSAGIAVIVLGFCVFIVHLLSQDVPGLRYERISLVHVASEAFVAGLPCGFGHFAMLHTQQLGGEACRHFTACGSWVQHAHNEYLDVAVDGGPVALALVLGLTALVAYRLLLIRDSQVRLALQLMGIAIVVHLLTDNVFGLAPTELWLGAVIGMIFCAPVAGRRMAPLTILPTVRVLAWLFTLLACSGAWPTLLAVLIDRQAPIEERLRCLNASHEPLIVDMMLCDVMSGGESALEPSRARLVLAQAVRTMGWNGQLAAIAAQQSLASDRYQDAVADQVRLLGFSPFYRQAYQDLGELLHRHPQCASSVPLPVLRRLSYLSGNPRLSAPVLGNPPQTIDDAADAYAGISWAIANGRSWAQIATPLYHLCRRYGDIPGVSQLVLQAVLAAPAGSFPWLAEELPVLEVGLRFGFDALAFFAAVTTPDQARALLPVIVAFYPGVVRDVRAGSMGEATASPELRNALVRLINLSGAAGAR